MPSPIRFPFGALEVQEPEAHVIEYGRLARFGSRERERLYATRQSSLRTATSTWHPLPSPFITLTMADPKKQEKDFTKEVDALLPEARSLAEVRIKRGPKLVVALTGPVRTGWQTARGIGQGVRPREADSECSRGAHDEQQQPRPGFAQKHDRQAAAGGHICHFVGGEPVAIDSDPSA